MDETRGLTPVERREAWEIYWSTIMQAAEALPRLRGREAELRQAFHIEQQTLADGTIEIAIDDGPISGRKVADLENYGLTEVVRSVAEVTRIILEREPEVITYRQDPRSP